MLQSLSRHGQAVLAAVLVLAFPGSLLAQRGPTGLAVTGTAASATITWQAVTGGVSYSVKRWKADDLRCCNNASSSLGKPTWTDVGATNEGFSQAGIYVFEVTVVMEDRTTGTSQVSWTRPDAAPVISREALTVKTVQTLSLAAPSGVTVRSDPAALVLSWQPVSGATGYQIDAAAAPTGPWTPLVPAPISATQFAYTPPAGTLTYYRVSAALSLAVSANSTIVPFIYEVPLNPLGVSAAQSGANVTVSWNPVAGASGYSVTAVHGTTQFSALRVVGPVTSATFVSLVTPGVLATLYGSGYPFLQFRVTAHFPPRSAAGADFREVGTGTLAVGDPSVCWPAAGELPGGSGQTLAPPVAQGDAVTLSWPMSGQVSAYRVDRALAGSGQWQPLACVRQGSPTIYSYSVTGKTSGTVTEFRDESIALQPSTSYQYRITAVGPADATGKRVTNESIVLATTPPRQSLIVGAQTGSSADGTPYVRLSWPLPASSTHVKNLLITSSYGVRKDAVMSSPYYTGVSSEARIYATPRGSHTFAVTPLYANGTPGATTTVTVVVP
jgi:hypothetical protein